MGIKLFLVTALCTYIIYGILYSPDTSFDDSLASQTAFLCGGGKKGLEQFTGAVRPDTFERVNKLRHPCALKTC